MPQSNSAQDRKVKPLEAHKKVAVSSEACTGLQRGQHTESLPELFIPVGKAVSYRKNILFVYQWKQEFSILPQTHTNRDDGQQWKESRVPDISSEEATSQAAPSMISSLLNLFLIKLSFLV